jgi:hypothetical protein
LSELPSVDLFPFGPFSGQSPFGRADGAVVPPFPSFPAEGSVVADGDVDAEGSGLAADTAATPPPTRRRAAIAAVATPRRSPLAVLDGGDSGVSGGACAGAAGFVLSPPRANRGVDLGPFLPRRCCRRRLRGP